MDLFVPPPSFNPTHKTHPDWQLDIVDGGGATMLIHRSSSCGDLLLQNCDLPPPVKGFSPLATQDITPELPVLHVVPESPVVLDSSAILKALRLSQTRAREAEKEVAEARAMNHQMMELLLEGSLRLSAHRRWVMLLQTEVSILRAKGGKVAEDDEDAGTDDDVEDLMWLTLALCLGIAGVCFIMLGRF